MDITKEEKENFRNELLKLKQIAEDVVLGAEVVLRNLENIKTKEELKQVEDSVSFVRRQ